MSRTSIRTFLVSAKRRLHQALKDNGTASFAIGKESADLDSITCALVYAYIQSSTLASRKADRVVIPVTNIPSTDLPLRPELTALLQHADVKPSDLITLDDLGEPPLSLSKCDWTLVDHNKLQGSIGECYTDAVSGVIDHHDEEGATARTIEPRIIQQAGSCNSLVINYCRPVWDDIASSSSSIGAALGQSSDGLTDDFAFTSTWDAQIAKLALGSILIDTHNMTDKSKVTEHDQKAVRYLEARINTSPKFGKTYDRKPFFEEVSAAKSDLNSLSLDDILRKDYKQWTEGDLILGISSAVKPVEYLQSKAGDFAQEVGSFAEQRKIDLFAIMTAYISDSGAFARQLFVSCSRGGKASDALQRFSQSAAGQLQLEDSDVLGAISREAASSMQLWSQKNVAASRKQVAPLLREVMR